ncbi:TetR/AcrR family transcriptional regulator [Beijerinckia indica]|uniref:Transcriptional regulator, TetR family n=1 Tax=Beijerinckia indica subsp. indica (strain ATCC 9039 / DSM 1715 / NCIMB 8712) TaxID=395963 RepID=B2IKS4_BEII9|nr:transcriptional regulator, TetR family [Beijerinckia indica subsp. indica ATCC 9039]
MTRPKTFDVDAALDAAIGIFREHGFEGTSAQMLVDAMGIGRQSLYDTFGDKWQLYQQALRRYVITEVQAHRAALTSGLRAIDGIRAIVERVVREAAIPCLGVGSIAEFGCSRPELAEINAAANRALRTAMIERLRAAQAEGDIAEALDLDPVATFLIASFAGIRIAGRSGARPKELGSLGEMVLRALR